ncbi:hypothetical protein LSH36_635g00021 [Paralvinella palmiformis]|uniref:Death domain-containing protein n=1 Tax=Paralvinella palmiformis TaxID=53620 RepID=A0AAD9J3M2_9ANNE|nr:hypothetical protein LSH36_635g00021 [Paralvinella palmiformis]
MSRPASRKSTGKGKNAKPKKKTPKQQIAELTEENENLTKELDFLKTEKVDMQNKIYSVTKKLVSNIRKSDFGIKEDTDLQSISSATLCDIVEKLVVRKQIYDVSVEARVAELEARLTNMTLELAKMTTKTTAYEMGLESLTKCSDFTQVKNKVQELKIIAGQEYNTFATNDPRRTMQDVLNNYYDDRPNSATKQSLMNAHLLNLTAPRKREVGETHIKKMHKDLWLFVVQELSPEKASGSDWRRFAERIGIDGATVSKWKSEKLKYPMENVLRTWAQSPEASVRMLHRHLISPQMRCTLVAKWVSDFYDVD